MASIIKVTNGDTIRAKITWTDWSPDGSGTAADPDGQSTTFTIYNGATLVQIATGSATREAQGVYYYDYTIPSNDDPQTFLLEFAANFSSKPQISRQRVVGKST